MENELQVWLDQERDLTSEERQWLNKLLSRDFPGRETLEEQVKAVKVIGFCNCGCRSVNLKVPGWVPSFPYSGRIPVEMHVQAPLVLFLLHVVKGYIDELEVVWGDPAQLKGSIPLDNAKITVNNPSSSTSV